MIKVLLPRSILFSLEKFGLPYIHILVHISDSGTNFTTQYSRLSSRLAVMTQDSSLPRSRSKTTYYHSGIGGRGNYHKRSEYSDPSSCQGGSRFSRSLAAFFNRDDSSNTSQRHTLTEDGKSSNGKAREPIFPLGCFIGIGVFGSRRSQKQHSPSSDVGDHGDGIRVTYPITSSRCGVRYKKEDSRRTLDSENLPKIVGSNMRFDQPIIAYPHPAQMISHSPCWPSSVRSCCVWLI